MVKFLYRLADARLLLSVETYRMLRAKYPGIELVRQFHELDSALAYARNLGGELVNEVGTGERFDKEHRKKLSQAKMRFLNPNYNGLSVEHRRAISRSMKNKNRAQFNVNYGKPRSLEVRAKISQTKRKQARAARRRWCVSNSGVEFLVLPDFILPEGWSWGRKRLTV